MNPSSSSSALYTACPAHPALLLCALAHLLGLGHVDTRVGDVSALFDGDLLSQPSGVFVKDDILIVLNKETVSVRSVEGSPHVLVGAVVVRAQELLQSLCGLPSVVVRDLGGDVVSNMSLADTVENPSTDWAEHVSVNGGEGSSGKSPLVGRVVGEQRVGVLEVGDEDQPVVDPKVRKEVDDQDLGDGSLVGPVAESSEGDPDSNVGNDDVPLVSSLEDDRGRGEVVGTSRVVRLS